MSASNSETASSNPTAPDQATRTGPDRVRTSGGGDGMAATHTCTWHMYHGMVIYYSLANVGNGRLRGQPAVDLFTFTPASSNTLELAPASPPRFLRRE